MLVHITRTTIQIRAQLKKRLHPIQGQVKKRVQTTAMIKLAMLVHITWTTIQIRAQIKKRLHPIQAQVKKRVQTTAMKSMKRMFVMRVRLGKDDMTMMIMKRSRERENIMMLMTIWNSTPTTIRNSTPTIDLPT